MRSQRGVASAGMGTSSLAGQWNVNAAQALFLVCAFVALVAVATILGSESTAFGVRRVLKLGAPGSRCGGATRPHSSQRLPLQRQLSNLPHSDLKVAVCTSIKNEQIADMEEWVRYYRCATCPLSAHTGKCDVGAAPVRSVTTSHSMS